MYEPTWPIETERLLLRPFEPGDLHALHAIHGDRENARWLCHDGRSLEETREVLTLRIAGRAVHGGGEGRDASAGTERGDDRY